jgi:hypothetical protein
VGLGLAARRGLEGLRDEELAPVRRHDVEVAVAVYNQYRDQNRTTNQCKVGQSQPSMLTDSVISHLALVRHDVGVACPAAFVLNIS